MDNFSDMLALEDAGRRRNDTKSTLRVSLKTLGFKVFKGNLRVDLVSFRLFVSTIQCCKG